MSRWLRYIYFPPTNLADILCNSTHIFMNLCYILFIYIVQMFYTILGTHIHVV